MQYALHLRLRTPNQNQGHTTWFSVLHTKTPASLVLAYHTTHLFNDPICLTSCVPSTPSAMNFWPPIETKPAHLVLVFLVSIPRPRSFSQFPAPTTSATLYAPPHTSSASPLPMFSTPDQYRAYAHGIGILGVKDAHPARSLSPGPHHFNDPLFPTPLISFILTA